jgi:translation initiation factor 2 subunit 3
MLLFVCCTGCTVVNVKGEAAQIKLNSPVCTERGEKIALSRRIDKHWRLIGWGTITKGKVVEIDQHLE